MREQKIAMKIKKELTKLDATWYEIFLIALPSAWEGKKKWVREAFGKKRESFVCAGKSLSGECKGCGDINGEGERSGGLFIEARKWGFRTLDMYWKLARCHMHNEAMHLIALKEPLSFLPYLKFNKSNYLTNFIIFFNYWGNKL